VTAVTSRLRSITGYDWRKWLRRRGWTVGVWVLLAVLIGWYASLIPKFGSFQIASIAKNSLPLVYLSVAQAVIVIAGGIDLSVGAMMILTNAVAAQTMDGQPFPITLLLAVLIILGAAVLNGSVGWIINVSKVPDIVVTLATSFSLSGLALLVLPSPGGGTSGGFRAIFTGSTTGTGTNFWPAVLMMAVPVTLVALFMRRTQRGLAIYATGSDRNAAYLSGVRTARAKMLAYAIGGAFGAMAGLAAVAITGSGEARFSTGANAMLRSVAAIVLGGIALTGGTGSVVGAAAAGIILFALSPILSAIGIDPNTAQVVQGSLIALVMMVAGLLEIRRRRIQ
jgi:ribose transport system permease protein